MTSAWLAWRTTTRYRARTVLATIGVAVIGALLFDMLLLSRGLVISFADLLDHTGFDVRVLNSQGMSVSLARTPIVGASEFGAAVKQLPEVAFVSWIRLDRATAAVEGGNEVNVVLIGSSHTGSRVAWRLIKGTDLPDDDQAGDRCPVLLGRTLAAALKAQPGTTLRVHSGFLNQQSSLPPVSCTVVGVAEALFASADEFDLMTTMRGLQQIRGNVERDEADVVMVASAPDAGAAAAVRAIKALRPDLHAYSNEDVLEQFNQNGFTYFRQISIVLSSITVVFTFLLVATILTVSTNQRIGEIAALRALGIGRKRIASMLLWESVLIVGSGGVLALPLGGAVAVGLDRILKQMPGVPDALHFFVFEPNALVLHLVLLTATALVAATYPIWLATRLPIASTLRREVVG
jgi:putative ABC transport system permease protein